MKSLFRIVPNKHRLYEDYVKKSGLRRDKVTAEYEDKMKMYFKNSYLRNFSNYLKMLSKTP